MRADDDVWQRVVKRMNDLERKIRARRRTVHPDVRVARLVMAGAAKEWLWRKPEELGLESANEDDQCAWESRASREQMERLRIEANRAALRLWWRSGRMGAVRVGLVRAAQIMLRPVSRLFRPDRRPA